MQVSMAEPCSWGLKDDYYQAVGRNKDNLEPVTATQIMDALIEIARNDKIKGIKIHYGRIEGSLDIERIADELPDRDGKNRPIIRGDISILDSKIKSSAYFGENTFSGNVNFRNTTFSKYASFKNATFSGDVKFMATTFSGGAYFGEATFSRNVNFWQATFSSHSRLEPISFEKATFSEYASFKKATFSGDVSFREATFEVNADFDNTRMKYPANFAGVNYNESTICAGMWNDIIRPMCWGCLWFLGRNICILWKKVQAKERIPTDFSRISKFICDVCDVWEKVRRNRWAVTDFSNVNTTTIIDGSSNPWLKRYIDDEQWIASWKKRGKLQRFLFIVWEGMCHCGRSIGLWAFWSLLFAVAFGFVYYFMGGSICFNQDLLTRFFSGESKPSFFGCIYYSVVTFTTLGFGDIIPTNDLARFVVMLEVILGYVMLGGLISIFANKLARRS